MTNAVRFHLSLNVADLPRSVAFYRKLFGIEPAKQRPDYAKFEPDNPPLVLSLEPNGKPNPFTDRPPLELLAFVRICTHYLAHGAWLEEGALLRDAGRLAGIPGVLIHGQLDLSCPLETAWELARAWPDAELVAPRDSGHQGTDTTRAHLLRALDRFARQ